jgi:hypothetical protein
MGEDQVTLVRDPVGSEEILRQPPAALRRLLIEGRDEVLRSLRCQERDRLTGT